MTPGNDSTPDIQAAVQRVQELSSQVTELARKNGLVWLEGYEQVLKNMLDLEQKAADNSGMDWASSLATMHANFVRQTSELFFNTLSAQLKS